MHKVEVKHLAPGLAVAELGPVCFTIWREAVDAPRFQHQAAGVREIARKYPKKSAFVCIVEPTCEPPGDEMRRRSVELIDTAGKDLACVAGVIEGSGFRAAIARSVLSGIALLFRGETPRGFFDSPGAASVWLSRHLEVDAQAFVRAVEEVRAQLPAVPASRG